MQNPKLKKLQKEPLFKMYQEVILVRESLKDNFFGQPVTLKKGQEGIVLLVNTPTNIPSVGYTVEFFDKKGETVAVSIVEESDIAALPDGQPDVKAVKPRRKNKSKARAA